MSALNWFGLERRLINLANKAAKLTISEKVKKSILKHGVMFFKVEVLLSCCTEAPQMQ